MTASISMLALTQLHQQSRPVIWIAAPESTTPGLFRVESDPSLEQMQSLPGYRPARNVDLIDMRYQPPVDLPEIP